jgi:phage terminase Nu1 subunit (DNA packaging protein)
MLKLEQGELADLSGVSVETIQAARAYGWPVERQRQDGR